MTRQLAGANGLSPADNARLYARLYLTGSDALISCWQDKARWLFWRPITAIREADRDGNPATEPDRGWLPLINNPPYPDHPSGPACVSSAMAGTLGDFFGTDRIAFSERSATSNTTRGFAGVPGRQGGRSGSLQFSVSAAILAAWVLRSRFATCPTRSGTSLLLVPLERASPYRSTSAGC